MAISPSRGALLPGFDCVSGEAISLTAAEWRYRTKDMKLVFDNFTGSVRAYENDKVRYEIFATYSEFQ